MNTVLLDTRDIETPEWISNVEPFAMAVLRVLGLDFWELSIIFCSDSFIRQLNREYRGKDEPTDVLSFQMGGTSLREGIAIFIAGDIVISIPALARNAQDFSVSADEELKRLVIHGILHLSGMDHPSNDPSEPMLKTQESVLEKLAEERIS
ncbi:MAG: putative rRNA maturation factor [Spirochaetes bacterium]|nr:MAG: putative rRNA maturation factor [Spirochaetota bacterium]